MNYFMAFLFMSFRTVVINEAARLSLDLNNIVIFYKNESFWINLDEIGTIIIDDLRCNVTMRLLSTLCEKGITLILTNNSHMPIGAINTLFNHSRSSKNLQIQIHWNKYTISDLWTRIIKQKIKSQIYTLMYLNKSEKLEILTEYYNDVKTNDITNREGIAGRIYFKSLFGNDFKRFNDDMINYSLNYSYQIIRAKISQEIVNAGYSPAIGIFHRSEYNSYNLADDLIEVYRPIIDFFVYKIICETNKDYFDSTYKERLVNIINEEIIFQKKKYKLHNTISLYLYSVFSFLSENSKEIYFPEIK